jgi:hypothetical protein
MDDSTALWALRGRASTCKTVPGSLEANVMRSGIWISLIAAVICCVRPAPAQNALRPEGPVVLTIVGDVGRTNWGPFDPFADKLMDVQGARFERAMAFDVAALMTLGVHRITVRYPTWPAAHTFEGPLLKDVLDAAGVTGGAVRPVALDGYAAEIPYADLERWPVVLVGHLLLGLAF